MTITQTVEIPADRRLVIDVPREVPVGQVVLTFTPAVNSADECPVCAKHRDPETGEPLFNDETRAGIKEVDNMLAGIIPNKLKSFNSLEEMLVDLDSDD